MTNDLRQTRWAHELSEEDLRRAREQGPGGVVYVAPPASAGGLVVGYMMLGAATMGVGFSFGYGAGWLWRLVVG